MFSLFFFLFLFFFFLISFHSSIFNQRQRIDEPWDITRTVRAINRCHLPGRWYQGGQNDRITYTNDEQSYYIHQQSNSMWVQGREDAVVNARLLASVARDDDSARPWAARAR